MRSSSVSVTAASARSANLLFLGASNQSFEVDSSVLWIGLGADSKGAEPLGLRVRFFAGLLA